MSTTVAQEIDARSVDLAVQQGRVRLHHDAVEVDDDVLGNAGSPSVPDHPSQTHDIPMHAIVTPEGVPTRESEA